MSAETASGPSARRIATGRSTGPPSGAPARKADLASGAQREEHRDRQEHRADERSAREEGRHRERAQREEHRHRQEHRAHERSTREEGRHHERREQPGGMDRIERLEMRFAELERLLKEIRQELRELKRGRRRE